MIRAVLSAESKVGRDAALLSYAPEILEDLEALRDECDHEKLAELSDAFSEALSAGRAGFHRSAQALCASIVTAILTEHYALPRFARARERLGEEVPGKARLRVWRRASIQSALLAAIAQNWPEDAPPGGFNRHRTAHSVSTAQFTGAHLLEALLLVGGLIRELNEIYSKGQGGISTVSPI